MRVALDQECVVQGSQILVGGGFTEPGEVRLVAASKDGHYRVVEALPEFKGIPPHDQNPLQLLPIRRRQMSQDAFQSGRAEVLLDEAEASLQDSSLDLLHESERLEIAGCLPWLRRSIHCCKHFRRATTMHDHSPEHVRLDKWLWAARFFKTRGLAAEAIDGGKIQVNGERAKRAKPLHLSDELRIRQGPYQHIVVVRGLSEHRGPASVATQLYEETPQSLAARQQLAAQIKSMNSALRGSGERPTKRDRREIERFRRRED